jgi:hypothetical protein
MRNGALLGLALLAIPTAQADEAAGDAPSMALLEYLADFGEDAQGHLLDPMEQEAANTDTGPAQPPSANDNATRRTDR